MTFPGCTIHYNKEKNRTIQNMILGFRSPRKEQHHMDPSVEIIFHGSWTSCNWVICEIQWQIKSLKSHEKWPMPGQYLYTVCALKLVPTDFHKSKTRKGFRQAPFHRINLLGASVFGDVHNQVHHTVTAPIKKQTRTVLEEDPPQVTATHRSSTLHNVGQQLASTTCNTGTSTP